MKALIAFDGWGVPLVGNFPIYRISHDQFTHWSSELLGKGDKSFYADPPVEHLDLWRSDKDSPAHVFEGVARLLCNRHFCRTVFPDDLYALRCLLKAP